MIGLRITLALSVYNKHFPFFDGTVAIKDGDLKVLAVGKNQRRIQGWGKARVDLLVDLDLR